MYSDERDHLVVGLLEAPGQKSRSSLEDLIGAPGFGQFALEALVLLLHALACRCRSYLVAVAVAPHAQGLLADFDLRGDGPDRVRTGTALRGLAFQDQLHGALT